MATDIKQKNLPYNSVGGGGGGNSSSSSSSTGNASPLSSSSSIPPSNMFMNLDNYIVYPGNGREVQTKVFAQNARHDNGGWKFIDEPQLKKQRGVCWELVKSVGNSIIEGKELVNTTLPIGLLEPRSFLEKVTDALAFAPLYLNKAAETSDPLERMKLIVAFCVSGLHLTSTLSKPFNPLLGETFEGRMGDNIKMYCEQTSHHPPISSWEMVDEKFHYYGYGQWSASCLGNVVKGLQRGPHTIEFADGGKITWCLPDILIKGIFFGDRLTEFNGKVQFVDEKNKLVCDMKFNPYGLGFFKSLISKQKEPSDSFIGNIYRMKSDQMPNFSKDYKFKEDELLCKVDGTWLTQLNIDGVVFWHLKMVPSGVVYEENPLPTDCRYRLDLKHLKEGDLEKAKFYKSQIEDKQRSEAKMRKDSNKKEKK